MTRLIRNKNKKGFTLVELMIVVAIIGVLAVLAVYGVSKYLKNAKTGEARNSLGMIAKAAVGAYEEERGSTALIGIGSGSADNLHQFCPNATKIPATDGNVYNKKYQSSATDWNGSGWSCLRFSLTEPQYYQYNYASDTSSYFVGSAQSGLASTTTWDSGFSVKGKRDATTGTIQVSPRLIETEGAADVAAP